TSESVTEGHPDKIADQISDAILDAIMAKDPLGRAACETAVTTGLAFVIGEITTDTYVEMRDVIRDTIEQAGYDHPGFGFDAETCGVIVSIQKQSPDIAQDVDLTRIREDLQELVLEQVGPAKMLAQRSTIHVNPTGRFVLGGPRADAGVTGRKIIVDSYGGYARHGGGCFSGKDPSKVDRSGAYAARYVAKNIVAAGLASKCEIQVAYAIGVRKPVSVLIDCFGTEKVAVSVIEKLVNEHFDLSPLGIIREL